MSLNPSSLSRSLLLNQTKRFAVEIGITATLPDVVYLLVLDSAGAFDPTIPVTCSSPTACSAVLSTQNTLPSGPTSGQLQVKVCGDAACNAQLAGATLSYSFTVVAPNGAPALARFANLDDWSTEQGNAAHNGFMPVTLDPGRFSWRWKWTPPNLPTRPSVLFSTVPVSSSARQLAFVSANVSDGSASRLFAVREGDGTVAWQVNYPAFNYPGPPAVYGDRVYTSVFDGNGATQARFSAYDAVTGNQVYATTYSSSCPQGCSPGNVVVVDGTAFLNPGSVALVGAQRPPVMAFDAASGAPLWSAAVGGGGFQSLAVDTNGVYVYVPNSNLQVGPGFTALARSTGATQYGIGRTAASPSSGQVYYNGTTPVLDGAGGALVRLNRSSFDSPLQRINLSTGTLAWESVTYYAANPAVADGTIYVAGRALTALSLTDGSPIWAASLPASFGGVEVNTVIATSNLVFVSTSEDVFAFDRAAGQLVWSFPVGGTISLSASGLLYVATPTELYAVGLQ